MWSRFIVPWMFMAAEVSLSAKDSDSELPSILSVYCVQKNWIIIKSHETKQKQRLIHIWES